MVLSYFTRSKLGVKNITLKNNHGQRHFKIKKKMWLPKQEYGSKCNINYHSIQKTATGLQARW